MIRGLLAACCIGGGLVGLSACGAHPDAGLRTSSTTVQRPAETRATPPERASPGPATLIAPGARAALATLLQRAGAEGMVALQALDGSAPQTAGSLASPYAWSSIKPVIVTRLLADGGGPGRLTDEQRAGARAALTASDNAAAMSLFQNLAARHGGTQGAASAMTEVLRRAGDGQTTVSSVGRASFSPYGQTLWSPAGQTRFMTALARGCLLDRAATAYLLGTMNQVVSDQRWGFGTLASVTAFKGGWGPDPGGGYLVRQMGLLQTRTGALVAFAAAVRPRDGSFGSGTTALASLAGWVSSLHLPSVQARDCPARRNG